MSGKCQGILNRLKCGNPGGEDLFLSTENILVTSLCDFRHSSIFITWRKNSAHSCILQTKYKASQYPTSGRTFRKELMLPSSCILQIYSEGPFQSRGIVKPVVFGAVFCSNVFVFQLRFLLVIYMLHFLLPVALWAEYYCLGRRCGRIRSAPVTLCRHSRAGRWWSSWRDRA